MPPLSLWQGVGVKSKDFKFFDRQISSMYKIGGVEFWIHKYLGPASTNTSTSMPKPTPELVIQDMVNMETRDRSYDKNVYSMKGHYSLQDTEFDLRQFGLFLSNETIFITFHLNDMVDNIGRKLMSGDVIEILNQRDDLVLGGTVAISKYYVVEEGTRPAEGYGPSWLPHIWRVKCNPMTDSQEFQDITQQPALDSSGDPVSNGNGGLSTLANLLSTYDTNLSINNAALTEAETNVPFRNIQGAHLYVLQGDLNKPVSIWAGDGIPPNESKPVNSGSVWPTNAKVGDYFLRTDYNLPILFERKSSSWVRVETDWRTPWVQGNRGLDSFINNTNTTTLADGTTINEQQALKDAVKPKLDPDIV